MKKITLYTLLLILATACFKDDRNNDMVADSFGITSPSPLLQASVHAGSCTVGFAKNGKGQTAARAAISRNPADYQSLLDAYNQQNGTSLTPVPASFYTLDQTELDYGVKDVVKVVTLSWDPEQMAAIMGESPDWVIPLFLHSDDATVKVNPERSFVMVRLSRSGIAVSQKQQSRSIDRKNVEPDASGKQPQLKETLTLDLVSSNPMKGVGMRFPVAIDNSLIAKFNEGQDKTYRQAPDGLVTVLTPEAEIPEGGTATTFQVVLDKEKLLQGGKLVEFPDYVVPVRVKQEGIQGTRNGEAFDIKGLSYGNMTTYITVSYAQKGISVVVREWGLYSDAGPWYRDLEGFAEGADRCVALDDQYVYVAHSASKPAIYALSRGNGSLVKKLDIGPAAGNGCTFPVSCVRVIPNTKGDAILSFCSLKGDSDQNLYVYAYVNGVDAPPVQILDYLHDNAGGADDWRRYGDRYTVEGTWQDGMLWLMTWSDGAKCKLLGFKLSDGKITNPADPVDYFVADAPAGIKDVVRYPGWENFLITRSGGAAIYRPASADGDTGWTRLAPQEELPDFALTYGYNFFDFHDTNFMAYMRLDEENGTQGRLIICNDTTASPSEFPFTLKAQPGLREFPIQHPDSFEAKSGLGAASSVGDCAVWDTSGNTYIAVLMQGCGLSLFQLQ